VTGALTASAAMNKEIALFFFDLGIPTYDCYGLTETAPAVTMNCPGAWKIGSVGKVLAGQKVVIDQSIVEEGAKDGEIVVYGPNVMKGYHNKPEATAEAMTPDGGFRTGDRGMFDEEGFLWITGRTKEQYKLSNGKYVFPAVIEEEIKLIPYVANATIYGDGKPYNVCINRWRVHKGRHGPRYDPTHGPLNGNEVGYLLTGKLQVRIGGNLHAVRPGDVIYLGTEMPSQWKNPGPGTARLLWIKIR